MRCMPMTYLERACDAPFLFSAVKIRCAVGASYALNGWRQEQIPPSPPFSKGGIKQSFAMQTGILGIRIRIPVIHIRIPVIQIAGPVMRTVNAFPALKKGATGDLPFGMQASRHQ